MDQAAEIVPAKIRLLSIVTGCVLAVGGSLTIGFLFSIYPAILILGALVQPRWHRLGRGLLLSGTLLLTAIQAPFTFAIPGEIRIVRLYGDTGSVAILLFFLVSTLLVGWCDVTLVANEIKMRRMQRSG